MNKAVEQSANRALDSIQERLTDYACTLNYEGLTPEVIHSAKVRVIDTLGALIGGLSGEPCRIARNVASQMPDPRGATIIGTRLKTTLDMAAFVNAMASSFADVADSYHWPGSAHGHPSNTLAPVLAAAEHTQSDGRAFITNVVLAYEIYMRFSDIFHGKGFDTANFAALATAIASGKLMGLSRSELGHCISMAIVPNVILRQGRAGPLSMFRAAPAAYAGRAGLFAAQLARVGMEGPHLPFEGKAGWCDHVAGERFSLDTLGGAGTPFKILDPQIKLRPSNGSGVVCILATEKIAPLNFKDVKKVTVEAYEAAMEAIGTGEHRWNPNSRETANRSGPYNVAATLMDGTVTLRSFNDAHLWNPELRALMKKIEFVENPEFTQAFEQQPVQHRARVTVVMNNGEKRVGETGGGKDDFGAPKTDAQIEEKFRGLTEDVLGSKQVNAILARLWDLENMANVAEIPPAFVLV